MQAEEINRINIVSNTKFIYIVVIAFVINPSWIKERKEGGLRELPTQD